MIEKNQSEADPVGNDVPQMVPLSSLMINLPVKFIRGNFDYFLGRLNSVFYDEAIALQLFVLTILLFVRTFCVNLTIFNGVNILSTRWEGRIKDDLLPGSLKQQD